MTNKKILVIKDGCWNWIGARDSSGYGQKMVSGKNVSTHRWAYESTYGKIPMGMQVLHSCDNPGCYNPEHLFLGTQKDNIHDAIKKGRAVFPPKVSGAETSQAKYSSEIYKEIMVSRDTPAILSKKLGICRKTIWAYRKRNNYV